jgi:hypothetical protein
MPGPKIGRVNPQLTAALIPILKLRASRWPADKVLGLRRQWSWSLQTKMPVSVIDSRIYRNLFGTEDIRLLFEDKSYAYYMITVETALARAQSKLGVIPEHIGDAITAGCHASKLE